MATEQEWESVLQIKTAGRDDSRSDTEHHPYEPTDYCVLERLANSGHIRKRHILIDYGSGKGRVSIFMAYQTGCHSIGIEYDERLYEKALINGESLAARNRVSFVHGVMRLSTSYLSRLIDVFSLIPLHSIRLSGY